MLPPIKMSYRVVTLLSMMSVLIAVHFKVYASEQIYDSPQWNATERKFNTHSKGSLINWLQMRFKEGRFPPITQAQADSIVTSVDRRVIDSPADQARATWIGHATVLVQHKGVAYLTDPHLTQRASPIDFWAAERFTQPALSFHELPEIDFVVISHNHYDHLDRKTVEMLGNSVVWYVPLGLKSWIEDRGIDADKVIELDWWQSHQYSPEVEITLTPSVHWSKRSPWNTNKSLWGSWSVKIGDFNSWFAGDTGYEEELFKEIGRRMGAHQLAFIPIGAYSPRHFMAPHHVDPAEAVLIHQDVRSEKSMPIHWGTFQLTSEPFLEPPALLEVAMQEAKLPSKEFAVIKIGETIFVE